MKRRGIVSLVLAAVLASVMSAALSSPASAADVTARLRNGSDTMCLQPINASQDVGAAVVQQPCNGRPEQNWTFHQLSGTQYRIENEASRRCLNALGGAFNGVDVVQWPCGALSNQTWDPGVKLAPFLPVVVSALKSRVAGTTSHCLDVPGGHLFDSGLQMQIWACNGTL